MRKSAVIFLLLPLATVAAESNALPPLAPPYGEIQPTFWQQHHAGVIVAALAFLVLVISVLTWLLRTAKPKTSPPEVIARSGLMQLQSQPEDGRVLSAISQILRHYASVRFDLSAGELTTAEFCESIGKNNELGAELAGAIASFLRECDVKKFSLSHASPPIDAAERALRLIDLAEARRASLKPTTSPQHATVK